jgi:indolepyruvate ferredoxin oxidoreductase beta subunit
VLYLLSRLRGIRRSTYRYRKQKQFIDDWLDRVTSATCDDYAYGMAVARCIEIVKGYGETYERGLTRYLATVDREHGARSAEDIRRLHQAALADEKGEVFEQTLSRMVAGA